MQRQDDIQGVAQNKVAEHVYACSVATLLT